jgi:hypothetical protein
MTGTPNAQALAAIAAPEPALAGLVTARDAVPLPEGHLGHAGPPFANLEAMPPAMLGALAGAVVHEGWAGTPAEARALICDGRITLHSNHDLGTVSPMTGVVRPSQVLMRVEDLNGRATPVFATFAEKGRNVLRFGFYDSGVADHLSDLEGRIAPAIARALAPGGVSILPLAAQGIELGDDAHQRNVGGMLAFLATVPDLDPDVARWLAGHPQHFLNYVMAAQKLCLDHAADIPGSTVVTALTRNGRDCAVRVSGTGNRWFRAPASRPVGGFFDGWTAADAERDIGDSAITEAYGFGGCIAHCSPEVARAMERDWDEASAAGRQMVQMFAGRNARARPALAGSDGVGMGLDAARVAAARADLRIHTGIADAEGQGGWIGIGVASAPLACFERAVAGVEEDGAAAGGSV